MKPQASQSIINGVDTGKGTPSAPTFGFGALTPFTISSGFVAGVNTLDFIVPNVGGPSGLQVQISGTATAVPEPSGFQSALAGGLIVSAAGLWRQRRRSVR